MNVEQLIRKRHELEDSIELFLSQIENFKKLARKLETRELEVAVAKIIDKMNRASSEDKRWNWLFKGLLAKSVFDARLSGEKKLYQFFTVTEAHVVDFDFSYPVPLTESFANDWGANGASSVKSLLLLPPTI